MLSTYLVCYYGATGGSCVCGNNHAAVEETAHNGGSCAGRLGEWHTLRVEGCIAVVVGEVEAAHGDGCVRTCLREGLGTAYSLRERLYRVQTAAMWLCCVR
jgi:hypothetical protein